MKTGAGSFQLEVPRDRNSTFEPQLVKKRQTTLTDELDSKILALYGIGSSYGDISSHLQDIYGHTEFPTTKKTLDILKFKPTGLFNKRYITNY